MKAKHQPTLSAQVTPSGDQVINNPIRRRSLGQWLGGLSFTMLFVLLPSPVEAQCTQWKVGHGWRLKQGRTNVDMDLHQNGNVFTGKASYFKPAINGSGGGFGVEASTARGDVDGTVKGDSFAMLIHWENNNTTGVYNGTIGPSGRIEGTVYDQATPSRKENWFSETHMDCADAAPAPAKKVIFSGKPRATPSPATSTPITKLEVKPPPPAPEAEVAGISASEANGTVTLTWNAGSGHPNTEVWVQVNDHDEKLLFTGSKGTKTVSVKSGKKYHYILREAGGEQLDTATIKTGR